jgi:hypothetical protein
MKGKGPLLYKQCSVPMSNFFISYGTATNVLKKITKFVVETCFCLDQLISEYEF